MLSIESLNVDEVLKRYLECQRGKFYVRTLDSDFAKLQEKGHENKQFQPIPFVKFDDLD